MAPKVIYRSATLKIPVFKGPAILMCIKSTTLPSFRNLSIKFPMPPPRITDRAKTWRIVNPFEKIRYKSRITRNKATRTENTQKRILSGTVAPIPKNPPVFSAY